MIKSLDELRAQIQQAQLGRHEAQIVGLAKSAIAIDRVKIDNEDDLPLGASKLGGRPDVPVDFAWPYFGEKPLTFIAQFKLSEVAPFDTEKILPPNGMLYFFYEADEELLVEYVERDAWQVIYLGNEQTPLVRLEHLIVEGGQGGVKTLPTHKLSYQSYLSVPSISWEAGDFGVDFTEEEGEAYWEFLRRREYPDHQFLGYANRIQYYVEWDCVIQKQQLRPREGHWDEYKALVKAEMQGWQFLFQLDTDYSLGVTWGAVGKLYVCLPKESLQQQRFEDCWTIIQFS